MALQSTGRPEPMNASPFHSKVKATLKFADSLFVAGECVAGKMEVECRADSALGLGVIMVELVAIEELTSRDHSATSTFLHCSRVFQGPGLPPSNAVYTNPPLGNPQLPVDYFTARRGITTFLFRLPIPTSSPSAINFGSGLANVRYEVRASVGVFWKGEKRLVTDKKEVDVVESSEGIQLATDPQAVVVAEGGKVWIQGRVVGNCLVAGQPACVELYVKNHSTKKNSGLSVSLSRDLHLPNHPSAEKPPLQLSDSLTSVSFRGQEYVIQPGVEGVANLVFDVPSNARGVKGGRRQGDDGNTIMCLFAVQCLITIKMAMGFGSKDIQVELPVTILHSSALPEAPPPQAYPLPPIQPYNIDLQIPSSTPAPYFTPYHHPLSPPPISPAPVLHSPPPFYLPQGPYFPPPNPNLYYLYPQLATPQHYFPLRPSSAEPIPSHPLYTIPSGLPPVEQPLVPLVTGAIPNVGREQGKGERASRISQHLRMSSRHRSVSPQAHRYHLHSHQDNFPYLPSEHSPSLSITYKPRPQPPSLQLSGLPNLSAPTNVVSPRPMLSPKHSFSVDPVGHASPSKSDRVKTLERIAALAVQDNCDMSTSMPPIVGLSAADKDKTLPTPPVPSQKPISKPLADRPQANTLFPPTHFHPKPAEETPRTPTITAIASLKVPRTIEEIKGGVSGLDALEARLLAEVGTRKVERDDQRPNVRSILPITIPRANASQGEPINDSAISSLTLPGVGGEETTPTVEKPKSVHSAELHDGEVTERGRKSRRGREDDYTSSGVKVDRRSDKKCSKRIKGEQNDGEIHQLRKIAQGRIAAWLGTIDPIAPPQSSVSPSPRRSPDPIPISLKEHPVPSEPTIHPFEDQDIEDESTTDAQPNPRSSGFVSIETLRLANQQIAADAPIPSSGTAQIGESPLLGKFLPARPNPGYDVHSARGGRGGQVTAVAAIWASATQASTKDSHSPKPLPEKIHRPMRPPTKEPVRGLPVNHRRSSPPLPKPKRPTGKEDVPPPGPTPVTTGNISSTRARMIKSTSVPAIVSSSLATPMLSSTASLARPAAHRSERAKLEAKVSQLAGGMQPIPEGRSEQASKAPEVKGSLAFGQARLRELIKRYQGQSNT